MSDNAKVYSKLCSKIGFAMLIFYAAFTLSTIAIVIFNSTALSQNKSFANEVLYESLYALVYFLSFSAGAFALRKMNKKLPNARPIYTSFKPTKWLFVFIIAIIAVNFIISFLNAVIVSSISPFFVSSFSSNAEALVGRPMNEVIVLFILSTVSTAVVPALCEEYLFRGAVLTGLMPYGRTTAIIASSVLFGLMHQNPMQLLYTTLMGVVIGYVYVKTKSIWACVLIHFTNNFITVLEEYLPVFTNISWISDVLDILVVIVGAISLLLIIIKRDKIRSVEETGSFGVTAEVGLDVEEVELGLSRKEKIRGFFSATVIVYSLICVWSIVQTFLSYLGIEFI